ncbi:MAG: CoA-binding protein [Desulfobacterales bacterium]|nr:CoA-binding protein [Desulfobacterales bacterium]
METSINFEKITRCFENADKQKRSFLYEFETYELLKNSGAETPPPVLFLEKGKRLDDEYLSKMIGNKVVLKIVSPEIIHKTEVEGVKIIENSPSKIRSAWRRMIDEVPDKYHTWIEKNRKSAPQNYKKLNNKELLKKISSDIKGVLLCKFMPPDSDAFGNELIVSIRCTREFGMVITAGLGGTDTELYAKRFRKGQAVVSASTKQTTGETFFKLFKNTIAYKKLAGISRGQKRIVSDGQLIECFSSFIELANHYSPLNTDAPYIIEELEINPFAFTDYQMVPLDGMCRFIKSSKLPVKKDLTKINSMLHPETITIIGVSETKMNFGRIILNNIINSGFEKNSISIIKKGPKTIDSVKCIDQISDMKKTDLFIVAVSADVVLNIAEELIEKKLANSVMLIPGGIGEKEGSEDMAHALTSKIESAHLNGDGPVFLGGNCMGVISHPGKFDTIFIPEEKLPKQRTSAKKNSAFISQSGAFLITRTSKFPMLDPSYMISIGNQTDLTAGDIVTYIKDLDHIDIIAVYMEGFNDFDGLNFVKAVKSAVLMGKTVLFYKAGRTEEGKSATSGHTASVAGDYMVCESCVKQAGAIVADTFSQFEELYMLSVRLNDKEINGRRLAALSGAGFEAVGMADSIQGDDFSMEMAELSKETTEQIKEIIKENRLEKLVDIKNPMDINPAANDLLHVSITEKMLEDDNVDGAVVGLDPMSPAMQTLPFGVRKNESLDSDKSIAKLMPELFEKTNKPLVGVVDGGKLYDDLVEMLEESGVPVFRSSDKAVLALAKYIEGRLYAKEMINMNQ